MKLYQVFLSAIILFLLSEFILSGFGFVKIYFFVFIPVFYTSSPIGLLPIVLLFIPFIWAWRKDTVSYDYDLSSSEKSATQGKQPKSRFGGFIMIGPVPILFGNKIDRDMLVLLIIGLVALIILWFVFIR